MGDALKRARLRLVEEGQPQSLTAYESEQRRHIMSRDWSAVHVRADRSAPIFLPDTHKRTWR